MNADALCINVVCNRMPHARAGKTALPEDLVDVTRLLSAYADAKPDPELPEQKVSFGTSGHRGSSLKRSFNEAHILAVTQALCDYRRDQGINGPIFVGKDTHGLSGVAQETALEVLAGNGAQVCIEVGDQVTPTPVISAAILRHNRGSGTQADGILLTPSHNPPEDGGFKYNPPNGGPADTQATGWIQNRANALLEKSNTEVKRASIANARKAGIIAERDFIGAYVDDLVNVVDLPAIADAGVAIGVDPLGGAALPVYERLAEQYKLNLTITNKTLDPTFGFMTLDHDGKIRMDCSSPFAMANLVGLADRFQIAFGNDADADRHGIVVPGRGLLNPNHYLAVVIRYLFGGARPNWPTGAAIGKTLVSSALIDKVAASIGRKLREVPVGFKWFVDGLFSGTLGFGGEESAGASFLRKNGTVWTTDKDGPLLCLLGAEILARTGKDPGQQLTDLLATFGEPSYRRIDEPATPEQRHRLGKMSPADVTSRELAGEPIVAIMTRAPGNDAPIGGLKVTAKSGWFAARPSGTENIYKIYAESFKGEAHLGALIEEAKRLVADALG